MSDPTQHPGGEPDPLDDPTVAMPPVDGGDATPPGGTPLDGGVPAAAPAASYSAPAYDPEPTGVYDSAPYAPAAPPPSGGGKTGLIVALVVVVILLLGGLVFALTRSGDSSPTSGTSSTSSSSTSSS
ncbi:MAG: hypothetical protein KDB33_18370, partial [Acidimicrobiales bacterium]|nr:hypothetical protein [Acidimicrobiales bacterium]